MAVSAPNGNHGLMGVVHDACRRVSEVHLTLLLTFRTGLAKHARLNAPHLAWRSLHKAGPARLIDHNSNVLVALDVNTSYFRIGSSAGIPRGRRGGAKCLGKLTELLQCTAARPPAIEERHPAMSVVLPILLGRELKHACVSASAIWTSPTGAEQVRALFVFVHLPFRLIDIGSERVAVTLTSRRSRILLPI